jgi:PGF-pre-PGF domain-containing protein
MRRILFLLGIVLTAVLTASGQTTFTSAGSGNWNSSSSWSPSGIPSSNDSVIIDSLHTITVTEDASVKGLRLLGTSGTRLIVNDGVTLTIYGSLSSNTTRFSSTIIKTLGTGKVKFVGSSRRLFETNWAANPQNWTLEIALNPGSVGTSASPNIKAGTLIISSGTLEISGDVRPDSGLGITGKLYIKSGAMLKVGGDIRRISDTRDTCKLIQIEGTLEMAGSMIVAENIVVKNGGVFKSTRTNGHTIRGTLSYESGSTLEYAGTSAQITGQELSSNVSNLKISNSAGVTLSQSTTAENLIFTAGKLNTGIYTLKVTGSILGAGAGKFVDGNLVLPVSSTGPKKWETGQGNDYLPLTINFTSLTGSGDMNVTVTVLDRTSTLPGGTIGDNKVLKRYFRVTKTGITSFSADLTLTYTDDDVSEQGIDENSLRVFQWDGTQWKELTVTARNTTDNTITVTGVTSFSDFVISGTGDAPLPVQVASVLADVSGRDVKIKIKTQTERDDFLGFNVYRSRDGKNFVMVGSYESVSSLRAKGNMAYGGEYEFVDKGLNSGRYQYKIEAVGKNEKKFVGDVISVEVDVPKGYALHQNYPNPFNPVTVIEFEIPEAGYVLIELYNSVGQKVRDIFAGELPAGYHKVRFDASGLSSGVYFYRMSAGKFNAVRKMVIMK